MDLSLPLICPKHASSVRLNEDKSAYICEFGCRYPIAGNIPRFVPAENYATSFGLQWNEYRTAQLDSYTGQSISRDRLQRLLCGSFDIIRGKTILEAGCGAGRFTEILLAEGARVCAVDLSSAVEAHYKNCRRYPDYMVCQADILKLPFAAEQFEMVICIGVLQATPNPEEAISALCAQLKPGGMLVIDIYSRQYPVTLSRRMLRAFLLQMPRSFSLRFCRALTAALWPLHTILAKHGEYRVVNVFRHLFLRLSPVVDYHDAYPQLGPRLLKIWAALDMHDTVTDHYKHLRSAEEIRSHLERCGMISIETSYGGNGVEARARKPLSANPIMMQDKGL